MKPEDFELFSILVKQRSGIMLTQEKAFLLESRLFPVARKHNMKTLEDLASALRSRREEGMMLDIVESMTTNETFFFRDRKIFSFFRTMILPRMQETRAAKKHLRIWSAAASSGQEAYSLAMICAEEQDRLQGWKIEIIGTDLSRQMVARSRAGIYSQFEVQRGLPIRHLVKYFRPIAGDKWQVKDHIRQMAQFREGNLINDCGVSGSFDIVFCRNVLSSFDVPTKTRVLSTIGGMMPADGYLLLGAGETASDISEKFKRAQGEQGVYVPASAPFPQSQVTAAR